MAKPRRIGVYSGLRNFAISFGVIAVLYLAREVLIPLAFAVTLALILAPAVNWLRKLHIARAPAALIAVTVSVAALGFIGYIMLNQFIQVADGLPAYRNNIREKIQAMRAPTKSALGRATENVKELGKELTNAQPPVVPPAGEGTHPRSPDTSAAAPVKVVTEPTNEIQYLRELIRPFLRPIAETGMVLIFTIFMLIEKEDLRNRMLRLAGLNRIGIMTQAFDDATQRVSRYLELQFMVNASFGFLIGVGLTLIGLPYAALWGAVAAIFRIVPYIGAPIAGLLPFLLSLAVFDHWLPPLLVLAMFVLIEVVTANLIEPWLYGAHTGISSLALLVTAVFWTSIWGPAGLILSTPLTVCLVVIGRHAPRFSYLHILLGDEPGLVSEAQLYQRLLAMDDEGARAVIEADPHKDSPIELCDSVLIPALALLERDRHKGTLDTEREEHVCWSMREILFELSKDAPRPPSGEDSAHPGRVFCIPATHESEEIIAGMLKQALASTGIEASVVARETGLQYLTRSVSPSEADVFVISVLQPFAFMRARSILARLRRKFPKSRVIVGVWGFAGDIARARDRFQPSMPDQIVISLASAVAALDSRKPIVAIDHAPTALRGAS
jgi:predicted PurR-regulated permease PerM